MPRNEGPGDPSGWDFPQPFVIEVAAESADVDSYGHVNNAVYLRWLERCAWAHSAAVGLPESACLSMQRGMAVHRVRLDYLAAAHVHDRLLVGNWISASDGRLRVSRHFQIRDATAGTTLLRGDIDYVCLNLATGRAVRLPEAFRRAYVEASGA
jgi:acyl-CoA thioester hydrolase